MTLQIHLQIVGCLLVLLGLSHAFMNRHFGWGKELAEISLLTRQIFYVHTFFHCIRSDSRRSGIARTSC
jgi:hypothetical protein